MVATSSPRIEVVVPTWNRRDLLVTCLRSVERQTVSGVRVTVVDNGSTDGTAEEVERTFPRCRLIRLPGNRGFAAAVNAAIRTSDAPFIALLNNDAVAEPGWLAALMEALERHPQCGAAASKVFRRDGSGGRLDSAGDGLTGWLVPYSIGSGERDCGQYDTERLVIAACAGAALVRRELLEEIGLFEESFFAYFEDSDLFLRALRAGRRVVYAPRAVVHHIGTASTGGRFNPLVVRLSTRNLILLQARNLRRTDWLRFGPRILGGHILWLLKMAVREHRPLAWARGLLAGILMAPKARRAGVTDRQIAVLSPARWRAAIRASFVEVRESIRRKRRGCSADPEWCRESRERAPSEAFAR